MRRIIKSRGRSISDLFLSEGGFNLVTIDAQNTADWARRGAQLKDHLCQARHAISCYIGIEGEPNSKEGFQYLKQCQKWIIENAEDGHPHAQGILGHMYFDGLGVPKNPAVAATWFMKAAEQDDAMAQMQIGASYLQGLGVPHDLDAAERWYRLSADQGLVVAQRNLGVMLYQYRHQMDEALEFLHKALAQGHYMSANQIAKIYKEEGYEQQAFAYYKIVAESTGYISAILQVGERLVSGTGIEKDPATALAMYNAVLQRDGRTITTPPPNKTTRRLLEERARRIQTMGRYGASFEGRKGWLFESESGKKLVIGSELIAVDEIEYVTRPTTAPGKFGVQQAKRHKR